MAKLKHLGLNLLAEMSRQLHIGSVVWLLVITLMQVNKGKVQAGPKKHKKKISNCIKSVMVEPSLVPSEEKSLRRGLRRNTIKWVAPAGQDSPAKLPTYKKEMPKESPLKVKESLFNNENHQ